MNNQMLYFDEMFPAYYLKGSRDFQLFAHLMTYAMNSAKVEADSLLYLNDAIMIADRLLPLLQTKVGFWTQEEFTNDQLRFVCDVFDLLVKKKGSRDGIVGAIQLFLKTLGVATDFDILITNRDADGQYVYGIEIGIESTYHDSTLLREVLKYIIPTGYTLKIYYYSGGEFQDKSLLYSDFVLISPATKLESSYIRNSYYTSVTDEWKVLGGQLIETPERDSSHNPATIQSIDMTTIYGKEQQ